MATEKTTIESLIKEINFDLLKEQKKQLLLFINTINNKGELIEALEGILKLVDKIQDIAVDELGYKEETVFDFSEEGTEGQDRKSYTDVQDRENYESNFHTENEHGIDLLTKVYDLLLEVNTPIDLVTMKRDFTLKNDEGSKSILLDKFGCTCEIIRDFEEFDISYHDLHNEDLKEIIDILEDIIADNEKTLKRCQS